jgi:succinate dehydrogenase / fumarate reductase cytochrome b subunit
MADAKAPVQRPLSPHLTVYRFSLSMAMSIVHRITGLGLCAGMLLLTWWLLAAASGQNAYGVFEAFATSWLGRFILFCFSWALLHHLIGGLRYFIWDLGYGLGPEEREWLVAANLVGSIAATILLWGLLIVFGLR